MPDAIADGHQDPQPWSRLDAYPPARRMLFELRMFSKAEAAKLLGVSKERVRRLVLDGKLIGRRLDDVGPLQIRADDLMRFQDTHLRPVDPVRERARIEEDRQRYVAQRAALARGRAAQRAAREEARARLAEESEGS